LFAIAHLKADQKWLVTSPKIQHLSQVRLDQPSRPSSEAYAQMERAMTASRMASVQASSGARFSDGPKAKVSPSPRT
jgi:hypothetical protein